MATIEWYLSTQLVPYYSAMIFMEQRVTTVLYNEKLELIWLLMHPPLYTSGTSACASELLLPHHLPSYHSNRGGRYTYHGPGQRIVYIILDIKSRDISIHNFIHMLETWISRSLSFLGINVVQRAGRIGLWVVYHNGQEVKIAAVGIHLHYYVSSHGIAVNITTNLDDFVGIIPCGLSTYSVVSLSAIGIPATLPEVDWALAENFLEIFSRN